MEDFEAIIQQYLNGQHLDYDQFWRMPALNTPQTRPEGGSLTQRHAQSLTALRAGLAGYINVAQSLPPAVDRHMNLLRNVFQAGREHYEFARDPDPVDTYTTVHHLTSLAHAASVCWSSPAHESLRNDYYRWGEMIARGLGIHRAPLMGTHELPTPLHMKLQLLNDMLAASRDKLKKFWRDHSNSTRADSGVMTLANTYSNYELSRSENPAMVHDLSIAHFHRNALDRLQSALSGVLNEGHDRITNTDLLTAPDRRPGAFAMYPGAFAMYTDTANRLVEDIRAFDPHRSIDPNRTFNPAVSSATVPVEHILLRCEALYHFERATRLIVGILQSANQTDDILVDMARHANYKLQEEAKALLTRGGWVERSQSLPKLEDVRNELNMRRQMEADEQRRRYEISSRAWRYPTDAYGNSASRWPNRSARGR